MKVSKMAETLIGSEIIRLSGEINQKIQDGAKIYNFTIGDFDPNLFPIPVFLEQQIIKAYQHKQTNYPPANGMAELREAAARYTKKYQGLDYMPADFLVAGGSRPLIYALYQTLLDPKDKVVFPVPSWNNNHYCHLTQAKQIYLETTPEDNFMPTAQALEPLLQDAHLLALNSPLNPTGTAFDPIELQKICHLVVSINKKRIENTQKPLYLMYDQMYCMLTYDHTKHCDPVSLDPNMRPYTIYIDGISKAFAATGVRVGWAFGPPTVIERMKSILSHIGAWSPKAEQIATARFLDNDEAVTSYLETFKAGLYKRLCGFHNGFMALRHEGFAVDSILPKAAIYLTVKFDLLAKYLPNGQMIESTKAISDYLLDHSGLALVPFYAFGASDESVWFRLSVGTCKMADIPVALSELKKALQQLK